VLAPLLAAAVLARAQCPEAALDRLERARQLVVVSAEDWNAKTGVLRLFERPTAADPWKPKGKPMPAVLGKSGLAWGREYAGLGRGGGDKREGDRRSAAGAYTLGRKFGFAPEEKRGYLLLKASTECVDDPGSRHYNSIVDSEKDARDWTSSEKMRSVEGYRRGVLIDYVSSGKERAGSCLFLHVWKGPGEGTAGCIAAGEPTVAELHRWLRPDRHPVVVTLPEAELGKWRKCLQGTAE
jgi:D-alanyl-D-alanine dipeptidase